MENTYFALQLANDLAPSPPDHLGEPDAPCAVRAFKFGHNNTNSHSAA